MMLDSKASSVFLRQLIFKAVSLKINEPDNEKEFRMRA